MKIGDLEIVIKRSKRRKTITVNIERDGSVNAVAPIDCDDETIRKELEAREYLICKHVAHIRLSIKRTLTVILSPDTHSFLWGNRIICLFPKPPENRLK